MPATRIQRLRHDSGDIVVGWLTKVALALAVLGVIGFDAIALIQVHYRAADDANNAAREAAEAYREKQDLQAAYNAAVAATDPAFVRVEAESFRVRPDGAVTLRVHRTTSTLLVQKIGPIKGWAEATSTGAATPAA